MAETVGHLYLCDMSPTMLQQAEGTPGLNITKKEMDEELQFDVSVTTYNDIERSTISLIFFSLNRTLWIW